jgi:hypothetical protein
MWGISQVSAEERGANLTAAWAFAASEIVTQIF